MPLTSDEARAMVMRRWTGAAKADRAAYAHRLALARRLRAIAKAEKAVTLLAEIYALCTQQLGWRKTIEPDDMRRPKRTKHNGTYAKLKK